MAYTVGPNLSPSAPLVGNQPLRAVFRRSATAVAIEVVLGHVNTSLQGLFTSLDERLGQAWVSRASTPTFTEDAVTIDLVTLSTAKLPAGLNASQLAMKLDGLVVGLPLVSLNSRVRTAGEQQRAEQRDTAAREGQVAADAQSVTTLLGNLGGKLGWILGGVVVVVVVVGALVYLPKPSKSA